MKFSKTAEKNLRKTSRKQHNYMTLENIKLKPVQASNYGKSVPAAEKPLADKDNQPTDGRKVLSLWGA